MSWTLGLIPLTKAIAESPVADALNSAQKGLFNNKVDSLLFKGMEAAGGKLGELANKLKMYDENLSINPKSIAKGLGGAVSTVGDVTKFVNENLGKLEKLPVVGKKLAPFVEEIRAPLGAVTESIDELTTNYESTVSKHIGDFAEKKDIKPAEFAEKKNNDAPATVDAK